MFQRLLFVSLAAALAASLLPCQTAENVTLLSRDSSRGQLAGVWGYTAPDGREIAVVGARSGTWFVETTDPRNLREVGFFSAPNSTWREVTSYGHFVYSVSEHHAGIRIFDLSDPGNPRYVGAAHTGEWSRTHSISVDPDIGRLYVNGTNRGMFILNVATNPTNPPILGRHTTAYVHDSHIRRGRAYLSEIFQGNLRIVDVTNPASLQTISLTQTPGSFTHNAWVTDDDALMITSDENSTGTLSAYDITNPAAPRLLNQYRQPGAIVHNVFIIGRTGYIAHYTAGFHMVDLANPTAGIPRLANYPTSSRTSGFNGAWGAYPFTDSGAIYVSDIQEGLFVLQVDCGHVNRFGQGTPGTGGRVPRAHAEGASPKVGASAFEMRITDAAPGTAWILLLGARGNMQVLGVDLHVDLAQPFLLLAGSTGRAGEATVPLPIPADPAFANARIHGQVLTLDPAGPQGLAASRGMWFGVCR